MPYITEEMFPLLRELVDEVVLISETDVKRMIRRLALGNKIISEGSAALSAAAAVASPKEKRGQSVAVISGGSIDSDRLTASGSDQTR